jgi:hypothetical protein
MIQQANKQKTHKDRNGKQTSKQIILEKEIKTKLKNFR